MLSDWLFALSLKAENNLVTEIESDPHEIGITEMIIQDRFTFRILVDNHQYTEKITTRTTNTWTEGQSHGVEELAPEIFKIIIIEIICINEN